MSDFFDPAAFLNTETTEEGSTEFVAVPDGEYPAHITEVEPKIVGQNSDVTVLDLLWDVQHPELADEVGRTSSKVRQRVFLDMNDMNQLDFGVGKNITLNRLRDALEQNIAGQPWSPSMLNGGSAIVKVEQRVWEGRTFNDVKNVIAA